MLTYLKVKIKSLAIESQIIRREELKAKKNGHSDLRAGLHEHRIWDVRNESRAAQLAYGFLRSRPYKSIEPKCYTRPDRTRIEQLALKYGSVPDKKALKTQIEDWMEIKPSVQKAA